MKRTIKLKAIGIDPCIWFFGTDEEIAKAEKAEARQAARIEKIISRSDFQQLTYKTSIGSIRSLHKSTRPQAEYQLSYIDYDGVPARHELYISTGEPQTEAIHTKSDLLQHFIRETLRKPLQLELITA